MIRTVAFFLAVALCTAQSLNGPVAAVEFYGSAPVDFTRLRTAFSIRAGDAFEIGEAELDADRTMLEFAQLVGDNRYSIAPVFVPDLKGWVVYVDVEPPAKSTTVWNPEPAGAASLPAEIVALYERSMHRFGDGGIFAGGETAEGYFLSKDPIMRADQLKLIEYARAYAAGVYRALETSASAKDRIAAAWIAGYAPKDKKQIAALLQAVNDPDSTVRKREMSGRQAADRGSLMFRSMGSVPIPLRGVSFPCLSGSPEHTPPARASSFAHVPEHFGSSHVHRTMESVEGKPGRWLEGLMLDVRFAIRQLRRQPSFTGIAVFVLALGIGATTTVFSVVKAVLLRPLPFERSKGLVRAAGGGFRWT